jgi:hypothetical protein
VITEAVITNVNAIGLVYDGFGVLVLGAPGFFRMKENIRNDAKTAWGFSPNTVRSLLLLRMDTAAGSILLFLGFVFQLLAALSVNFPFVFCLLLWVFVLVYSFTYWLFLRSKLHRQWSTEMIDQLKREAGGQ